MSNRKSVKHTSPKARFSFKRHIVPPLAGLFIMALIFGGLNAQWIAAQYSYRFGKPAVVYNTVTTAKPTDSPPKSPNPAAGPWLTIPKIKVSAPVVFEPSYSQWKVQLALRQGVLHYGATAAPGQDGNTVIFGHSSGALWAPGNYKFVFTLLNKLQPGDQIMVDYKGIRYTYIMTDSKVVEPTDLTILDQTKQPELTLVTCTPVGTSKHRLVVHAQQISPSPIADQAASNPITPVTTNQLPGSASASLWHYLFGLL